MEHRTNFDWCQAWDTAPHKIFYVTCHNIRYVYRLSTFHLQTVLNVFESIVLQRASQLVLINRDDRENIQKPQKDAATFI